MSILIKGMEIPTSCDKCRFCVNGFTDDAPMYECAVQSYENVSVLVESDGKPFGFRPDWCPLVEIPTPHGRLGDLDALYEEISNGNKAYNGIEEYDGKYPNIGNVDDCLDAIKYADTVIEAEGSET